MAYAPLNIDIYSAAFAGAMAQCVIRTGVSPTLAPPPDYTDYVAVAAAWAEEVDTIWTAAPSSKFDNDAIQVVSNVYHMAHPVPPGDLAAAAVAAYWVDPATALVTAVQTGDTNLTTLQNINPLPKVAGNRTEGYGQPTAVVTSGNIVAAMKLVAKSSGMFAAGWNFVYNGLSTDLLECITTVWVDNVAGVPITLSNATAIGYGTDALAEPGNVVVADNNVYMANAAAGILLANANAGFILDRKPLTMGAAPATGAIFTWNGTVGRNIQSPGAERPVPIGKTCCITFAVTDNHGASTTNSSITGYMFEL
jgi:hypothetical protein